MGIYLDYVIRKNGTIYLTSNGSFVQKETLMFNVLMAIDSFDISQQGGVNTENIIEKLIYKFSTNDKNSQFITFKTVEEAETFIYFFNRFFGEYVRSEKSISLKRIKKFFKGLVKR